MAECPYFRGRSLTGYDVCGLDGSECDDCDIAYDFESSDDDE